MSGNVTGGEMVGIFAAIWLVALILVVAVEFFALGDPRRGDTASEGFYWLRARVFVWAAVPAVTWIFFHWTMPWETDGRLWNDFCYILVGLALALWNVNYRRRKKP